LEANGTIFQWSSGAINSSLGLSNIVAVTSGISFNYALGIDGTVWQFSNAFQQIASNAVAVSMGVNEGQLGKGRQA
jgi:hypothetical protein